MHHYRNDETDTFFGTGAPTTYSDRPALYIDRATGVLYINLGSGSTWYVGARAVGAASETLTGATRVLTIADNGIILFLDRAAGVAITLPANSVLGFTCSVIVKTAPTTTCTVTAATSDTIIGYPINCGGADSVADGNAAGDVLNFVANTALPGDRADFVCDGTSWHVHANAKAINAVTITG